mgnify:CR=1 FL=1
MAFDANNYVDQRPDGSFGVVINGAFVGSYPSQAEAEQAFNSAGGGGGGGGGGSAVNNALQGYMGNVAQQNAYKQAQEAANQAYLNAKLQGENESSARNAAIQAGSNAMSAYVSLLNAYGGGAGLDPNQIAAFIRGEGSLSLPSGPTLEGRKTMAEMQANPRDIFKLAAYQAGLGQAPGAYSGFGASANEQQALEGFPGLTPAGGAPASGGGGAAGGGAPGQGEFTRFVRAGGGGQMSPEAQTLYGQTRNGQWVAFESPEQFYQAAGVKSFQEAWNKNLIENRFGEISGQGIFKPEGGAVGYSQWQQQPGGTQPTVPGAPVYPGGSPIDPNTGLPWSTPNRGALTGAPDYGAAPSGGGPTVGSITRPPTTSTPYGGPIGTFSGSPAPSGPGGLPQFEELRQRFGSAPSGSFPFAPQTPLPQPRDITLGYMGQRSPFQRGLLESAYSTAGLSPEVMYEPFRKAERAFGGGGGGY